MCVNLYVQQILLYNFSNFKLVQIFLGHSTEYL